MVKYNILFKTGKVKNVVSKDAIKIKNYITEHFEEISSLKRLDEEVVKDYAYNEFYKFTKTKPTTITKVKQINRYVLDAFFQELSLKNEKGKISENENFNKKEYLRKQISELTPDEQKKLMKAVDLAKEMFVEDCGYHTWWRCRRWISDFRDVENAITLPNVHKDNNKQWLNYLYNIREYWESARGEDMISLSDLLSGKD